MTTAPSDPSARAILDLAAQLDAAESRIKQELLDAAKAGDCARVIVILERWLALPAVEVLADGDRA